MDETKAQLLISGLIDFLVKYEIEMTAYAEVLKNTEERAKHNGLNYNLRQMLEGMAAHPQAHAEAMAYWQPLRALTEASSLDTALQKLQELGARRWGISAGIPLPGRPS